VNGERTAGPEQVGRLPFLRRNGCGYAALLTKDGPEVGYIEYGPNMHGWGWTVGLGWHTGLLSVGAALDALLADPALGLDVHSTSRGDA
jgi:hypothetical protein